MSQEYVKRPRGIPATRSDLKITFEDFLSNVKASMGDELSYPLPLILSLIKLDTRKQYWFHFKERLNEALGIKVTRHSRENHQFLKSQNAETLTNISARAKRNLKGGEN